jgi:hypothetical protein
MAVADLGSASSTMGIAMAEDETEVVVPQQGKQSKELESDDAEWPFASQYTATTLLLCGFAMFVRMLTGLHPYSGESEQSLHMVMSFSKFVVQGPVPLSTNRNQCLNILLMLLTDLNLSLREVPDFRFFSFLCQRLGRS